MQVFDTAFFSVWDRNFRGVNMLLVLRLRKTGSSKAWCLPLDLPPHRPLVTLNESCKLREIKEANPMLSQSPYTYWLLKFQWLSLWTNLLRIRVKTPNEGLPSKPADTFCTRLRWECLPREHMRSGLHSDGKLWEHSPRLEYVKGFSCIDSPGTLQQVNEDCEPSEHHVTCPQWHGW